MKAIVVRLMLGLGLCVSAGTAHADPILTAFGGTGGTVSEVSIIGNTINFDVSNLTEPVFVLVTGLDARQNYTVDVNVTGSAWSSVTAEILNPVDGPANERDAQPQPEYVPSGFSTSTDYDGFSFAQGVGLERSFLAAGGSGFSVVADELTDARDLLTFTGLGFGNASLLFGLRDHRGGGTFLIRLAAARDALATPEPGALLLVGTGLIAVARTARKRRKRA